MRKKDYFKSLNNIDKLIYLKGCTGFIILVQKYCLKTLRLKGVGIFFDLVIGFNIIFLTFTGIISDTLVADVNYVTTILLLLELLMRLISIKICK